MKLLASLTLTVLLFAATAMPALASHGATQISAPVPAHGSVWFGNGLERYETASLSVPNHGSVWFGSGLERLGAMK